MTIEIACAHCGEEYKVKDEAAGRTFTCKACGKKVRIPILDDDDDDEAEEEYVRKKPRKAKRKSGSKGSSKTLGPAIGLYVTGGLAFAWSLFSLIVTLSGPPAQQQLPPNLPPGFQQTVLSIAYGLAFFMPLMDLAILGGAVCLQTCRMYPLAMASCILASIPCCSPLVVLGMPFGIWGLVVLMNDDVKRAFR